MNIKKNSIFHVSFNIDFFVFAEITIAYRKKKENGFNYRTISVKYKALKYFHEHRF